MSRRGSGWFGNRFAHGGLELSLRVFGRSYSASSGGDQIGMPPKIYLLLLCHRETIELDS
jgi:hypothetical protein